MSVRVDSTLLPELKKYGAVNLEACFNCGNCTAICPLTEDTHPFPRNMIRYVQLGLKDRLLQSTDPWLCYYCGECSQTCPKSAEPAETMMSLRRWLTAQYDRSGHSAKLYTSEKAVVKAILSPALLSLVALVLYHVFTGFRNVITDQVALNTFAPVLIVWAVVLIHGLYLGYRIFSGMFRMFRNIMQPVLEEGKIPLRIYLQEFKEFLLHLFTQKRWRDCDDNRPHWLNHLLMISGYAIMLALILGLLWWFQTDEIYPLYHPQRWLGYYATIVLLYGSIVALVGRIRKKEQIHRFSHPTDWLFPSFILIGAVTGILVHAFRYAGWPWPTYILYVIHIMAMVAMLDTEVGVGKWAHLFYRPLAMYLERVRQRALETQPSPSMAPEAALS